MEASGKLSMRGRDKEGNPIMIWRHCKHLPEQFSMDRDIRFIVHMMEKGRKDGYVFVSAFV